MEDDHEAPLRPASTAVVDGIPVAWVEPAAGAAQAPVALWLPPLGRSKEDAVPFLRKLAETGHVAISLDPYQHGERGGESADQIRSRVFGAFRRYMWPILGQTTLDCLRIVDWAMNELAAGPRVVTGGVSMGGDIAVAFAGVDRRVTHVAAIAATPDWTRPDMRDLADPARLLPQGRADAHARWFAARLDPLTHLDAYAHGPAITFECGTDDTHVPAEAALRFQAALAESYPNSAERVRVRLHSGLSHAEAVRALAPAQNCLAWFVDAGTVATDL